MTQKWLPASSLIGGEEGALDAINGSELSDGDRAVVIADRVYFYILDGYSGLAESSPDTIAPDLNAGDKRWILKATVGEILEFPEIVEKTTDYTLLADDLGRVIEMNVTGAGTITVPADTTHDFEIGTIFRAYNLSADPVTVAQGVGVTVHNAVEISQYGNATLRKRAADEWIMQGSNPNIADEKTSFTDDGGFVIAGGSYNSFDPDAENSGIVGGDDNTMSADSDDSMIIGGTNHNIADSIDGSVILGGDYNTISADVDECAIVGGYQNTITDYIDNSAILGGEYNTIVDGSEECAIVGGYENNISADVIRSVILGGDYNTLADGDDKCAIVGGYENEAKHTIVGCGMLGGYQNRMMFNVEYSATVGGENNVIGFASEKTAMVGGKNNLAKTAKSALVSGEQNVAMSFSDALGMEVSGVGAFAQLPGQKAHANGFFDIAGDAQVSNFVMKKETIDGVATFVPLSADFDLIPLMMPKSYRYTLDVIARQTAGTAGAVGETAMWRVTGGIKNVGAQLSQGTVSFSGATAEGDTVVIGFNTYTFKNTPSGAMELQAGTSETAAASLAKIVKARDQYILNAEVSGTDVILTVHPGMSGGAMSIDLTCFGANISCDGGGHFGGTTAWAEGTISAVGIPQGDGKPELTDCEGGGVAAAAQGTITVGGDGSTTEGETFEIAGQTFTWTATPSGQFDIPLSSAVSETGGKIESAVNDEMTTITAEQTAADTVVVTAADGGAAGNALTFTSSTANVSMDGSGTLGGTTEGASAGSPWEVNVEVDDYDMGLKINVTGETDKTIHWVAKVQLVEVG